MSKNKDKIAVWKAIQYQGLEHFELHYHETSIWMQSVVIAVEENFAFRLDYSGNFNHVYAVTELYAVIPQRQALHIVSDGHGKWRDADDNPLPELDGCIDVDISATPFTNTLPIRRIQW
ncbi:MAG TPA: putative glycolipid-binding domain-containing protein, partial [Phototrophicaceae bacterium]|nr:putative glycolipid-binding domain-containing protein [Phototrophicaceae bacterium]